MIYLDYQATTPIAPEVRDAMLPFLGDQFGNPHSPHRPGREAKAAVELARDRISSILPRGKLVFTSGATEALNLALKGAFAQSSRRRIVTIATEHAAVLDSVRWLESRGAELVVLNVGTDGIVDLDQASQAIDDRVAIVAAMLVNNEIGVIQPIGEIEALARKAGALFLCDAVQGIGRVPLGCTPDLIALSAHKIHGPKGVGALWMKEGIAIEPQMHGGGQEGGLRSGTLAPFLCVGFGMATRLMVDRAGIDRDHVERLWDTAIEAFGPDWIVNGSKEARYHGNLNIRRKGLDVARLMADLRGIAFSAGSACASGSGRPSHVLKAIGLSDAEARASIRLGFGRYTREEELREAISEIRVAAEAQGALAA